MFMILLRAKAFLTSPESAVMLPSVNTSAGSADSVLELLSMKYAASASSVSITGSSESLHFFVMRC